MNEETASNIPTFDEWHLDKYHESFEKRFSYPGVRYDTVFFHEMMKDLRDYVSEAVRG